MDCNLRIGIIFITTKIATLTIHHPTKLLDVLGKGKKRNKIPLMVVNHQRN